MKNQEITSIKKAILDCSESKTIIKKGMTSLFPIAKDIEHAKELICTVIPQIDFTIKNVIWQPEYDNLCEWMVNPEKGLILSGDSGRLKTVFSTLFLPVMYMKEYRFRIRPIKSWQIAEELKNPNFLQHPIVIADDIGEEPIANGFGSKYEPFSRLVDECERLSKLLIATTNLDSVKLAERYGNRPMDRLDLICEAIVFKGKSFR